LRKKLWTEALLNTQKVHWHLLRTFHNWMLTDFGIQRSFNSTLCLTLDTSWSLQHFKAHNAMMKPLQPSEWCSSNWKMLTMWKCKVSFQWHNCSDAQPLSQIFASRMQVPLNQMVLSKGPLTNNSILPHFVYSILPPGFYVTVKCR
jgi:hypothetical protein